VNNPQIQIDNNQQNYYKNNINAENIGYNYDNEAFNNPSKIYQKPLKNRVGNINTINQEEYIKNNVKSFNNRNKHQYNSNDNEVDFQNMNYSNISNNENQNMNYSRDEMGNYEILEHNHENYHKRSPDSLLRYNNSSSQSPEYENLYSHTQNNINKYKRNNNNHGFKDRERSSPENLNDPYFKK